MQAARTGPGPAFGASKPLCRGADAHGSLNSNVEILTANVKGLGGGVSERRLGHEAGALVNGVSAFMKGTQRACLPPSTTCGYSKGSCPHARKRVLTRRCVGWSLDLGQTSQTVRITLLSFIGLGTLVQQPKCAQAPRNMRHET